MTVWNHLKKATQASDYAKKLDVWVPHELTQRNLIDRISIKTTELINRKDVVFHHDNVRPHTSLMTRQKLREFGWEVLMHPPYSPNLAPSDYHLFRSLQNSFDGKAAENHLKKFFADKPQKFYTDGIMKLPEKWQKVIDNNGQYILD
ncbi:SETMR methyltransferase, partial [Acromyrmex insinuator]